MIPFYKPFITGKEVEYIKDNLSSINLAGDGKYSQKCRSLIEEKFSATDVLLTPSCTHALELAGMAIDIQEGDEVIIPAHTFVSSANAFYLKGAKPVFVDIRSDTLNIDEEKIEEKITSKTKAIVPVHYAGVACEMDKIMEIAKKHNLVVIEDAAQGVNATYKGKYLGTIGDFGCYSFHSTKNYACGEGGAILVNNKKFLEKAEVMREKGTNRNRFIKGEIEKYSWIDKGSSYLLSDILASFLYAQLEAKDEIKEKRKRIYERYYEKLARMNIQDLTLPVIPEGIESNYHFFHFLTKNEQQRNELIAFLKSKGIGANSHYTIPLPLSAMGLKLGNKKGTFPIAENTMSRLIRIPFYVDLSDTDQDQVVQGIQEFFEKE